MALIRSTAQEGPLPRFAVLVGTTQLEDKGSAFIVDRDIECIAARTNVRPGGLPPRDGGAALLETLDLALVEQIGHQQSRFVLPIKRARERRY